MALSVSGLASGLDTNSIISQLTQLQKRPIIKLQEREAAYQVQLTSYGNLQGLFGSLQTAVTSLKDASEFASFSTQTGNKDLFTATADGATTAISYSIKVNQLAQSQKLKSAAFTSSAEIIGGGTLHLQAGSTATDIAVSGTDTLTDVATAINTANIGVQATVLSDGSNSFLTLTSKETGTANAITLTATDDDGNNTDTAGLSRLVYEASGTQNLTETQLALDASIDVDGVQGITRSSNTISDVISGVTLTLKSAPATAPDNTSTLSIEKDTAVLRGKINTFVNAYNEVTKFLKNAQAVDKATGAVGTLQGDSTTNLVRRKLNGLLDGIVPGQPAGAQRLSDLGITKNGEGLLEISDSTALDQAISTNFESVSRFFTQDSAGVQGFAVRLSSTLDEVLDTKQGVLAARQKGISTSINRIEEQISKQSIRVNAAEKRLQAQFNALESLLSRYKSTEGFLNQQITGLQNLNTAIANRR